MVVGPAPASAGSGPAVRLLVTVNGGHRPAISLDCADPTCDLPGDGNYPNQTTPNPTGTVAVPGSVSAALVATLAGCDPASVQTLVVDPTGRDVTLSGADVTGTDFLDSLPAVFYDFSGVATFRRPLRTPTDLNGADTVQLGATLHVAITTTPGTSCMSVDAKVNHATTTVGTKLRFTVTAQNPKPGETLTATWDFRDGSQATATLTQARGDTATTVHAYTAKGTYAGVTVTVQGDAGSSGSASVKRITVGKAAGAPGPGAKHHNRHHRSTSGSPNTDTSQPTSGTGNSTTPSAQTTTPTSHHRAQAAKPAGSPVSGVLVSSKSSAASPPSAAQGVGGTESPDSSGPPVKAIGGIALALGLVALGALSDRRGLRRRRKLPA